MTDKASWADSINHDFKSLLTIPERDADRMTGLEVMDGKSFKIRQDRQVHGLALSIDRDERHPDRPNALQLARGR